MVSVVIIAAFSSCQKEQIKTTPIAGTYRVSSLIINGTDITQSMAGYTIKFDDNGTMSVKDSMNTYNCNWTDEGMMNDMHDYHFDLGDCPDNSPMQELNADWMMDSHTDNACSFHQRYSSNNVLSLQKI